MRRPIYLLRNASIFFSYRSSQDGIECDDVLSPMDFEQVVFAGV